MKITFLGSGGSYGMPAAGGFWGACDPQEPKNKRTRASIIVETEKTRVLVDTSYDLRIQLNRVQVQSLDAVLWTHDHSDHVNGIDDLRPIAFQRDTLLDVYADAKTIGMIDRQWPFVFNDKFGIYKAFLKPHIFEYYDRLQIGDMAVDTFEQDHMVCKTAGYRFGDFAYSVDMVDIDDRAVAALRGVKVWAVDCCSYKKTTVNSHANLERVMKWVDIIKPEMTYLTVLSSEMDYNRVSAELPPHIRPAYDGLVVDL